MCLHSNSAAQTSDSPRPPAQWRLPELAGPVLSHVQAALEGVLGREVKTAEEVPALGKETIGSMRQWGVESGGGCEEPTVCSPYVTGKGCQIRLQPDEKVLIQGGSCRRGEWPLLLA